MFRFDNFNRVILNTDAKNEADDQYCIVQTLLSPSVELHGIIPAHFGSKKSPHSLKDSHDEVIKVLDLMDLAGRVRVADGATQELRDVTSPNPSAGADLIIREALKDDPRPLYVAFLGPLTDMASALLIEPEIAKRNVKVVWIGGREWPTGGWEYNLSNDVAAARVVFQSGVELWQLPSTVFLMMSVGYAELMEKVHGQGKIGTYLVEQLFEFNRREAPFPMEFRSLGDTPALSVILNPRGGRSTWVAAPEITDDMHYVHSGRSRPIKVYEAIDTRFILEDFFAKLARFAKGGGDFAKFSL